MKPWLEKATHVWSHVRVQACAGTSITVEKLSQASPARLGGWVGWGWGQVRMVCILRKCSLLVPSKSIGKGPAERLECTMMP